MTYLPRHHQEEFEHLQMDCIQLLPSMQFDYVLVIVCFQAGLNHFSAEKLQSLKKKLTDFVSNLGYPNVYIK